LYYTVYYTHDGLKSRLFFKAKSALKRTKKNYFANLSDNPTVYYFISKMIDFNMNIVDDCLYSEIKKNC
jgi:hypothetical protein